MPEPNLIAYKAIDSSLWAQDFEVGKLFNHGGFRVQAETLSGIALEAGFFTAVTSDHIFAKMAGYGGVIVPLDAFHLLAFGSSTELSENSPGFLG